MRDFHAQSDDDSRKQQIVNFIDLNPGTHLREIKRRLGLAMGVAQYHLNRLERERTIVSRRKGFYKRYYTNLQFGEADQDILDVLSLSTERDILLFLIHSSANSKEIANFVKLTVSTVVWHMKRLNDAGLIAMERDGVQVKYTVKDTMKGPIVKLLASYHPSVWQKWADVLANVEADLSDINPKERE